MTDSNKQAIKWYSLLMHIAIWVLILILLNLLLTTPRTVIEPSGNQLKTYLVQREAHYLLLLILLMGKAVIFYTCALWILPFFYKREKVLIGLLIAAILTALVYYLEFFVSPYVYGWVSLSVFDYAKINGLNLYLCLFALGLSLAYFFSKQWQSGKQRIAELEQYQQAAELKLLKSQLDPHFLFNVLNSLFSTAQKYNNPEVAEGIARLAELMRYALQHNSSEKVLLGKEIDYAMNYINLIKTRYESDEVIVHFKIQPDIEHLSVPFMLLVPFIENAFKYGVKIGTKNEINFSLSYVERKLTFSGSNRDYSALKENQLERFGIGLANIQKRLNLLYPEKNSLTFGSSNGFYNFAIVIEL